MNNIILTILFANLVITESKGVSNSAGRTDSDSESFTTQSHYSLKTTYIPAINIYSNRYYLNPIQLYFIWFPSLYYPYISLNYILDNRIELEYCKLSDCNSTDQEYIISSTGNYSINTVLSSLNNMTNLTLINKTLETNYGCFIDVNDCLISNIGFKINKNIKLLSLILLALIIELNFDLI